MHNYPLLDLFWTMLEFFLWILWLFLLFKIISDVFRNHESSGWVKAGWIILVILLPFLGVLIYVIVNGGAMSRRDLAQAQDRENAFKDYVRQAAATDDGTGSGGAAKVNHADELAKIAELRTSGALTEEEFQRAKAKILA